MKKKLLHDGGWVALGQIMSALAALASIRIMTELLQAEEFGRVTLVIGVVALAHGLILTPHLQAVIRFYPEWRKKNHLWILRNTASSLINRIIIAAALIISLGGGIISVISNQAWYLGLLIAALLMLDGLYAFELAFLNSARRQREAAILQSAYAWSRPFMAVISGWFLGFNAEAAVVGYMLGTALVLMAAKTLMQFEESQPKPRNQTHSESKDQDDLNSAIRLYALPLAPLAIFGWLSGMGDRFIVAGILSLKEAGLYAAAYGLASRPFIMLSSLIEQTMRPVLQNAIADGKKEEVQLAKRRMLIASAGSAIVCLILFILIKDLAAFIFLAKEYRSTAELMPWIALGYALLCVASVYTRFCYAFDATRYVLILTASGSMIGVATLIPATLNYGLHGAAIAVTIRFAIEMVMAIILSRKAEGVQPKNFGQKDEYQNRR